MNNTWANSAQYYDIILGKKRFERSALFISKILNRYKANNILELGCGTGLYLAPLKKKRFNVEGVDISKKMLKQAKPLRVPLYLQNMSRFNIPKKYDAILCLNSSLLLLPNTSAIEKTIQRCKNHLCPKGILILDLPHHEKEISVTTKEEHHTYKISGGVLELKSRAYKKANRWVEEWRGMVRKRKNKSFREVFGELLYSAPWLENVLRRHRFKIVQLFGSRTGGKFTKDSYRRVYLCRLR